MQHRQFSESCLCGLGDLFGSFFLTQHYGLFTAISAGDAGLRDRLLRSDPIVGPVEDAGRSPRSRPTRNLLLLLLFVLFSGFCYGVLDSRRIRVEHVTVPCPDLPPALDGFTIVQLSDLHSTPDFDLNREAARLLEGMRADLLVITGDFRNSGGTPRTAAEGARLVVLPAMPRMPVYAVQGNNDNAETMKLLEADGIRILDNRAVQVKAGLWLAGWNPYKKDRPALAEVMRTVPRGAPAILAAHSPDVILEKGFSRAQLILAGHTHGLQIRVPGLPSPITLTRVGWRYTRGLYRVDGSYLYINRGIGTTMIPLRVYSAPEITVLKLHHQDVKTT